MVDWTLYSQRLNVNGTTQRERLINQTKENLSSNIINSPSYKIVTVNNNKELGIVIVNNTSDTIKRFENLNAQLLSIGDILLWNNGYWLVTSINSDSEIYQSGTIRQCNFKLRYQNNTSTILEQWCLITDSYAETSSNGKVITTVVGKTIILLPYNDNTKMLYKDKRILLEKAFDGTGKEIGVVYKITGFDGKTNDYGNGKLITLTIESDSYSSEDSLTEMVCNYVETTDFPTPSTHLLNCVINGVPTIRMGGTARTLTAVFYKSDGTTVDNTITPVWNVDISDAYNSNIHSSQNGNSISIWTDDLNELIGEIITLSVVDNNGLYNTSVKKLEVV